MFSKTAKYYDLIYGWKDYVAEATAVKEIIAAEKRSPGKKLLDIACGTGVHLALLYDGTGIGCVRGVLFDRKRF